MLKRISRELVNSLAVYPYDNNQGKYIIYIISDKYNEANFWNGEWRSHYIVDLDQKKKNH